MAKVERHRGLVVHTGDHKYPAQVRNEVISVEREDIDDADPNKPAGSPTDETRKERVLREQDERENSLESKEGDTKPAANLEEQKEEARRELNEEENSETGDHVTPGQVETEEETKPTRDYATLDAKNVDELKELAKSENIQVKRKDGKDGDPLKSDYIGALRTDTSVAMRSGYIVASG